MFEKAIAAARDRKIQERLLLACLICYIIPATVAAGLFWRHHGPQGALSLFISLVVNEIALVLSLCATLIQMTSQVFCMRNGHPVFPSSRGKRLAIILLSIVLMQIVQGTTGSVGSLNSFFQKVLPPKSDFKRNLSMFTWPSLVASGIYTLSASLTVILAVWADANTGDVESGGNNTLPFLPPAKGFPDPLWSLAHRGLQFASALWSLFTMILASDYQTAEAFVFLVRVLISQCLWSGLFAIVGLCTIWGYGSSLLVQKLTVRAFVYLGDMVMMGLLFHAACGAASIFVFIAYDVKQCYMNNCEIFAKSTVLAFASHMALFLPSTYTTIKRVYA